ncbi:ABC transporter permease [Pseudoxanthomonas beigongshangi]|uniref:ABC transporter permease n=1 Tax=Pseudoxanthomonas beigongshangi TaxID=2782537 RepID=UPI00193BBAAC|nr:FtsX-like permease family protein [Pseudoxanthomonas beigongshangi]
MDLRSLFRIPILLCRHRGLATLLVLEVAVGFLLLYLAWQAHSAWQHARTAPSGVSEASLLVVPPMGRAATVVDVPALMQALRALPGVEAAVATNQVPYARNSWNAAVGDRPPVGRDRIASIYMGGADMPRALGLDIAAGRDLLASEDQVMTPDAGDGSALPALVTRSLAEDLYPGGPVLGRPVSGLQRPARIVGVVDRAPLPLGSRGHASPGAALFLPLRPGDASWAHLLIRTAPEQRDVVAQRVHALLVASFPERPVAMPLRMDEMRLDTLHAERRWMWTTLACAAGWWLLTLLSLGVAGQLWVQQSALRISLHRAVGATARQIRLAVRWEHFLITLAGIGLGAVAARALLHRLPAPWTLEPASPLWLAGAALVIMAVAQLAATWPARRAANVAPERVTRKPWVRL